MKRLAIIGSGDLGKQIAHLAIESNQFEISGFFDDFEPIGKKINGYPILGKIDSIKEHFENGGFDELLIGIGYNHIGMRQDLFDKFKKHIPFGKIIHCSCMIDKSVTIGSGTILYSGNIIDMNSSIGDNCLIYNGCLIAHDSVIASNSILSPGVQIAGFCNIGSQVNLGIGTIVSDNVAIVNGTKSGAGAVIVDSITEPGLYVGIPAKKIKA